jgi:hypothetical protein
MATTADYKMRMLVPWKHFKIKAATSKDQQEDESINYNDDTTRNLEMKMTWYYRSYTPVADERWQL